MTRYATVQGLGILSFPDNTDEAVIDKAVQEAMATNAKSTPIGNVLAKREADVAGFQVARQQAYEKKQAYAADLAAKYPELAGASSMQEQAPAVDPYLSHSAPPLPAASKQKFGTAVKLGLVDDPQTKRRIMADSLFPGDPEGINRVGFSDGVPVYVDDEGNMQQVTSGLSRFGASQIANAPETAGAVAGSLVGPWWGTPAGASGAHLAKRYVASKIFNEPLNAGQLAATTGIEGAAALGGAMLGRLGVGLRNQNKFIDLTPKQLRAAEAVIAKIKTEHDIDLDLAQAAGNRRLIATRGFAARSPTEAADKFQARDESTAEQFHEATRRVLDRIASEKSNDVTGSAGVDAARQAIRDAKQRVSGLTDPDYRAAYERAPVVTDPDVLQFFKHKEFREAYRKGQDIMRLEEHKTPTITVRTPVPPTGMHARVVPQMHVHVGPSGGSPARPAVKPPGVTAPRTALTHEPEPGTDLVPRGTPTGTALAPPQEGGALAMGPLPQWKRVKTGRGTYEMKPQFTEEQIPVPNLRALDYTKQGLDAMIEERYASGQGKLAGALSQQRKRYVAALDNLANPEYQAARKKYAALYEQHIAPLENGPVGTLAKIKDPDAATAAAKLFEDDMISPAQIALTRKAIQQQDPKVWNDLVRSWLSYRLNAAKHETQSGAETNLAGKFRNKVFADPQQRKRMEQMLPPDALPLFASLMDAAKRIGSTPVAGSVTRHDTEIANSLKGSGANVLKWFLTLRKKSIDAAEQASLEKGTNAIADAILDPAKRKHLRRVLRMSPSNQRTVLLSTIIGAQQVPRGLEAAFPNEPDSGPFAQ